MHVALKPFVLDGKQVAQGQAVDLAVLPRHRQQVLERLRYVKAEANTRQSRRKE
jgi:hypothetical protein